MKTQEYGCLFVNICISDALAMAAKITLKIAVVAVCLAETWITAAMTVRSVQTVPSTGNDMNQDSDYNTTPVPVACGSNISNSTVGSKGGKNHHLFCPTQTGRVEASTCGSSFETEIQTNGTTRDSNCADCPADSNASCVGFNFRCGGRGSI